MAHANVEACFLLWRKQLNNQDFMLLLGMAGADELDIIADYQVSDTYILSIWQDDRLEDPHAKPVYMYDMLEHMRSAYGGCVGYLSGIGVTQAMRDGILEKFLF